MDNDKQTNSRELIFRRVSEIQLMLLDLIKRNLDDGKLPGPILDAYEVLARAERTRCGL